MPYEVERKFRVEQIAQIAVAVLRLGGQFELPVTQVDSYLNHPQRDFASTDEALRVRQVGEWNCVTYKGPKIDRQTKTRREIEVPIDAGGSSASQMIELFTSLGFRFVAEVRKTRRTASLTWQGREIEIALDEIAGLGDFVELETQADVEQLDPARQVIASLAQELGLANDERRSYLELLLALPEKHS